MSIETRGQGPSDEGELSLGRELRRAREVRGFTLEQIAQETKISERYLRALETDRLDLLPGRVYARSFVKTYAQHIGADEEELLDYFNYQSRLHDGGTEKAAESPDAASRRTVGMAVLGVAALLILVVLTWSLTRREPETEAPRAAARPAASPPVAAPPVVVQPVVAPPVAPPPAESEALPKQDAPAAATAAVAATALPDASATRPARPAPTAESGPAPEPAPVAPARAAPPVLAESFAPRSEEPEEEEPRPAAPAAPTAPAGASASAAEAIPVVRLEFREESWMELRRDGDAPVGSLQKKGTIVTYRLDRPLSIMVGNAGAVECTIDSRPCKPLGAPGEARSLKINKDNFRAFLQ